MSLDQDRQAERRRGGSPGAAPTLRFTGTLAELSAPDRNALLDRGSANANPARAQVQATVVDIIARVRRDGDAALHEFARAYDGVALNQLEVPREAIERSLAEIDPALRAALERSARNLGVFHRAQRPAPLAIETEPGIVLGWRVDPLERVGVYAPCGSASYPSSVLMAAIPARVAGVAEIILCSPPDHSGAPAPAVLTAAAIAGIDRVFAIGGAGAIAALAYGTASVPHVDRIVGPGNAYVVAAKLAVSQDVLIDSPAGPSEILVLADATADPLRIARELLAQAEHDPLACAVAVAIGGDAAAGIANALAGLLAGDASCAWSTKTDSGAELNRHLGRRDIIRSALRDQGGVLVADSLDEAIAFANAYAPEHLLLALADARGVLARIRNAGTVFLGDGGSVAFGDYMTGANHVLPTGGTARAYSGLSILDFIRTTTWQEISAGAAARLADDVALFADVERLPAHAAAARAYLDGEVAASSDPSRARVADMVADEQEPLRPRASYAAIALYGAERSRCAIDLSDNTNAFGTPPAARRALRGAPRDSATRYPSAYSDALRRELAHYAGATPHEIVTGCGSDDILDAALRAFAAPGDRVAYIDPTFSMIPDFARMNGLDPVAVPLGPDLDADSDALLATGARVIYLCSPNNPTGTRISAQAIERVVAGARGLVILDRAYAEYCAHAPLAGVTSERLLEVRTLSKAFGLAGLRIGYGIGTPAMIEAIAKARGPFKVNELAEIAAIAALTHDRAWVEAGVRAVRRNRRRFVSELEVLGFAPLPSRANFVLVPMRDAALAAATLRAQGIAVRPFHALTGIGDALRITIGRRRDLDQVRDALAPLARTHAAAPMTQEVS